MTTALRMGWRKVMKVAACGIVVAAGLLIAPDTASAQWGGYGSYGGYRSYYNGPVYHAPSMHYDQVYHEVPHWTPWRGWHTHGHYDVVPHYTPGHYDYKHGNHVHGNPQFHNH